MVKNEIGKKLHEHRISMKMSRATLADRLGVHVKTIQSWERGISQFDLEMIPHLHRELNIDFASLFAQLTNNNSWAGHESVTSVTVQAVAAPELMVPEIDANQWVSVPFVRPSVLEKFNGFFARNDILRRVLIPSEWVPYGGLLIAVRLSDSSLSPNIPKGATVILDRTHNNPKKEVGQFVGIAFHDKGFRLRKLVCKDFPGNYHAVTVGDARNKFLPFSEEKGDRLIGRVVGWLVHSESVRQLLKAA